MAGEIRQHFQIFIEKPWLITLALAGVLVLVIALALVGIGLIQGSQDEIKIIEAERVGDAAKLQEFLEEFNRQF